MKAYRAYLLDDDDNVHEIVEFDSTDDRGALTEASGLRLRHAAAEVWQAERLVGRLGAAFSVEA